MMVLIPECLEARKASNKIFYTLSARKRQILGFYDPDLEILKNQTKTFH